jgi:hypothetical protein
MGLVRAACACAPRALEVSTKRLWEEKSGDGVVVTQGRTENLLKPMRAKGYHGDECPE